MSARRPQAVILAAGKGTRMKSARPKVLHEVLGLPILEYVLRATRETGAEPTIVVVGHGAEAVRGVFGERGLQFVEQDPPLGTGHALRAATRGIKGDAPLLVVNGDLPLLRGATLKKLLEHHKKAATLLTFSPSEAGAYGRVVRGKKGEILRIVEAKDATREEEHIREVNAGVYVFEAAPLSKALEKLEKANAQGEYYLTDVIAFLAENGGVEGLELEDSDEVMGVNTLGELAEASRALRRRILESLLASGVVIEDPESTHIGPDCAVDPDASIRPFTILEGHTRVSTEARVGPFVRLVSVEVGRRAQILDHCFLRECIVEEGASVGPFAHIRPESRIGAGAKVGNFVELKKTSLGKGSKAQHLSYLGDATIGPAVNIGAGTITCNYDGKNKHPTHIEEGAFVGSDSTLVAPVTVGAGAYIGAGSTITEDVPPDALALGRARQILKPGWAKDRKGQK